MSNSSGDRSHVELLAEDFLARHKRGEKPTIGEYCSKHPELASEIREVFEAVLMVEDLKPRSGDESGTFGSAVQLDGKRLERVGDYRILREIGRGGMGVVYEAEQEALGRRVALKVLPGAMAGDAKARGRFEREAKAAARMHHTNIVPVFDVGQDGDHVFYAMQMIHGQGLDLVIDDLRQLRDKGTATSTKSAPLATGNGNEGGGPGRRERTLAASLMAGKFEQENLAAAADSDDAAPSNQPQTETTAFENKPPSSAVLPGKSDISTAHSNRREYYRSVAQIGLQTASALSYAHSRGIVHRDIKPSNLLLDAAGVVWVTDFGLAKTSDAGMTHTGDIIGTIRYMPPERFRGHCDARADVYALGLTLYELLILKPAFASPDRLKLIEQIKESEPVHPRSLDWRLPRDLETIVLKAIDKEPRRRYQSADDMAADLQHFIADEPIQARRTSSFERFVRWTRRNPVVASLTAAVILVTIVGFAATYMQKLAAEESERRAIENATEATTANVKLSKSQEELTAALAKSTAFTNKLERATADLNARTYATDVTRMSEFWEAGNVAAVQRYLDKLKPKPGEPDLRGFEWHYFNRLCNSDLKTIRVEEPITKTDGVFSEDGRRLFTAGNPLLIPVPEGLGEMLPVKVHDTSTGKTVRTLDLTPPFQKAKKDGKETASGFHSPLGGEGQVGGSRLIPSPFRGEGKGGGLVPISFPHQVDPPKQPDPKNKFQPKQKGKGQPFPGGFDDPFAGGFRTGQNVTLWNVNRDGSRLAFVAGGSISGGGGQGAKGSGPGAKVSGMNPPAFDLLGKGREFIEINDVPPTLRPAFEQWAKEEKNTSGKVTPQQFSTFTNWFIKNPQFGFAGFKDAIKASGNAVKAPVPTEFNTNPFFADYMNTIKWAWPGGTAKDLLAMGSASLVGLFAAPQTAGPFLGASRAFLGSKPSAPGAPLAHLRVLDVASGKSIFTKDLGYSYTSPYAELTISPDGNMVAWHPGTGNVVLIWTVVGGKELKIDLQPAAKVGLPDRHMTFSPDGKRLASANIGRRHLTVWDTATGKVVFQKQESSPVSAPAFSPDGKLLAMVCRPPGASAYILMMDCETGEEWDPIPAPALKGPTSGPTTIAKLRFSRDGSLLAGFSLYDSARPIFIWDVESGEHVRTLRGHSADLIDVVAVVDDADAKGQRFLSASLDGTIKEWNASGADVVRPFNLAGFEKANQVAVNSQRTRFAVFERITPGGGKQAAQLKLDFISQIGIWDTKSGFLGVYDKHSGDVRNVEFGPDGKLAASVGNLKGNTDNGELRVWDTSTRKKRYEIPVLVFPSTQNALNPSIVANACFSPDGKRLALISRPADSPEGRPIYQLQILEAETGRVITSDTDEAEGVITIGFMKFSPDGKRLIAPISQGGGLQVWDTDTAKVSWRLAPTGMGLGNIFINNINNRFDFSADGKRMAITRGQRPFGGKAGGKGGKANADGGEVLVIDVATGKELWKGSALLTPSFVQRLARLQALSPDGKWLALGSGPTNNSVLGSDIEIWDVDRKEKIEPLRGNLMVQSIAFTPDGRRLLVKDGDQVKLWDLTSRQQLLSFKLPAGATLTDFDLSPDGRRLMLEGTAPDPTGQGGPNTPIYAVLDATPLGDN